MLLLCVASLRALGLRGNPEASKAAWQCAAAMGGSTNLLAIEEMHREPLRAICSRWPSSSVLPGPATVLPPFKFHFRLRVWASRCEHPPHTWLTRRLDRASK